MRRALAFVLWPVIALAVSTAHADTVKVLTAGAFKQVVLALAPKFEARTGNKLDVENDTVGALAKRIDAGEGFDVVVMTPAALKQLADEGKVAASGIAPIARVAIGVAVKAGMPRPAVGTVEQFKQAVLHARKVAYIDPASGGSSGIYLEQLFQQLGIADSVRAKAVRVQGGLVADKLVDGEADLAIHQVSEILAVKGVTLVGTLPEAIQNYTTYAGAVSTASPHARAAQAFLGELAGPDAAAVLHAKGMIPPK
jgi:molybdate transport system substrate-binding protein